MMINTQDLNKARKEILSLSKENKKPIIVKGQNLSFNRKILEYGCFDILLSPEQCEDTKKDKLRQLNGGLNRIMAKIAKKNKISIGIDLDSIRLKDKKEKAILLSKIKQNIKICQKANCSLAITGTRDTRDIGAFLLSLGASTSQIKKTILF